MFKLQLRFKYTSAMQIASLVFEQRKRDLCLQSNVDLEGVVDAPLQTGEGTDHNDTEGKAASKQADDAHI